MGVSFVYPVCPPWKCPLCPPSWACPLSLLCVSCVSSSLRVGFVSSFLRVGVSPLGNFEDEEACSVGDNPCQSFLFLYSATEYSYRISVFVLSVLRKFCVYVLYSFVSWVLWGLFLVRFPNPLACFWSQMETLYIIPTTFFFIFSCIYLGYLMLKIYVFTLSIDFCTFCGCVSIPCICAYLHLCICTLCQAVPIEESTLKIETRFSGNCIPLPNISFHWMGMYLCLLFAILVFLGWECICVFFGWECVCVFYLQY